MREVSRAAPRDASGGRGGLSDAEARRRLAASPPPPRRPSRSYRSIAVANVFTLFNAILLGFGLVTLLFGEAADALFLGIVVANSGIGAVQEIRAKRALDRLAAVIAPRATVLREGRAVDVPPREVVAGDLVRVSAGDQIVADGALVRGNDLRLDASILTGESHPVTVDEGEPVRSGSFVAEGAGEYLVTAAGEDSYAERLTGEARAFRHPRSPLERALNRLLLVLVAAMLPLAAVLGISLVARHTSIADAVPKATAAMVGLVPEGLVLLASLTFAVAAARMASRGALVQQLNAVESLASADVVCIDKTGTLTDATLRVVDLVPAPGTPAAALEEMLTTLAGAAGSRNGTLAAIAARCPGGAEPALDEVPFSSRRRWSAVRTREATLVLGAPELLVSGDLRERADAEAARGRRVVALRRAEGLRSGDPEAGPPAGSAAGLVVLAERLRPETADTVRFLHEQGVRLVVLSGDAPATVGAIAADAGIGSGTALDGRKLPADAGALVALLERHRVVGRIAPEDKRRAVEALAAAGRYVAMVGDGVNDVPAMKAARLAIAQASGAQMARSVADIVLVSGDFAAIPQMVAQGRQILRNVQRVAKLFVTKSALAAGLILTVGTTSAAYPFLPRHLTIASTFGVGVPAFFLALAPSSGPWRSGDLLRDVMRFALPAGGSLVAGVLVAYGCALRVFSMDVMEARTACTTVLLGGMLGILWFLERSRGPRRGRVALLLGAMVAGYGTVIAVPATRRLFALAVPTPSLALSAGAGVLVALGLAWAALRRIPS